MPNSIPITLHCDNMQVSGPAISFLYSWTYQDGSEDTHLNYHRATMISLKEYYNQLGWQETEPFETFWQLVPHSDKLSFLFLFLSQSIYPKYTETASRVTRDSFMKLFHINL